MLKNKQYCQKSQLFFLIYIVLSFILYPKFITMTNYKTYDLVPLEDHILVEPLEVETTTKSGIILPTNKDEKPACGVVIAVGPGKILDNGQR